ncbi:MAG: NfeD family protein [Candidatus Latescibacterota bacterium]|nr:NfeD family protein [Candidatus Latescibacterota bacterium]
MGELIGAEMLPWAYAVGLLILGFALILLEIFVIPGMNIFGVLGFGTVCIGVLFAYRRLGPEAAFVIGVLGMSGTGVLIWLLVRNRAWQRLVHETKTDRESGYHSGPEALAGLVGEQGTASTDLRPAGRAQFGEQAVDVVTEGDFITAGATVKVLEVRGNRVVVHEKTTE